MNDQRTNPAREKEAENMRRKLAVLVRQIELHPVVIEGTGHKFWSAVLLPKIEDQIRQYQNDDSLSLTGEDLIRAQAGTLKLLELRSWVLTLAKNKDKYVEEAKRLTGHLERAMKDGMIRRKDE